jgi:hypothetical protein
MKTRTKLSTLSTASRTKASMAPPATSLLSA